MEFSKSGCFLAVTFLFFQKISPNWAGFKIIIFYIIILGLILQYDIYKIDTKNQEKMEKGANL